MDISQIRLQNLEALIEKHGSAAFIADKIGSDASVISVIRSEKYPKKNMGDGIARRIEEAFSLPYGWMDQPHQTETQGKINEDSATYEVEALLSVATPTLRPELERIQTAIKLGLFEDSDTELLKFIAAKYKDRF